MIGRGGAHQRGCWEEGSWSAQGPHSPEALLPSGSLFLTFRAWVLFYLPWELHSPLILTHPWLDEGSGQVRENVPSPEGPDSSQRSRAGSVLTSQPPAASLAGPGQAQGTALLSLHPLKLLLGPRQPSQNSLCLPPLSRFMEIEEKEEMQTQKLQWMKEAQGPPPPAPQMPDSQEFPAPVMGPQPGMTQELMVKGIRPESGTLSPRWSFSFNGLWSFK